MSTSSSLPGPEEVAGMSNADQPTTPLRPSVLRDLQTESTPVSMKASSLNAFTTHHNLRDARIQQNGTDMWGKFVGPMPPRDFLETFLPMASDEEFEITPDQQAEFDVVTSSMAREVDMYRPMVRP